MAMLLVKLALAYLLGSLSGSLLVGRLRGLDIRQHGSGNAGGTNALRVAGWRFALAVVLIDVGKGALAVLLGAWSPGPASALAIDAGAQMAACGFAAVLGHCWPLFFGFRGGKGAGTAVGAIFVLAPPFAAILFVVWASVLARWRYVGLATVSAAVAFPLAVLAGAWTGHAQPASLLAFAIAIALLVVYTHRGNLRRMREHREPRLGGGPIA